MAGRRILDAGCGSGPLSAALRDWGTIVTSIDSSATVLELAGQRLGDSADLHLADLGSPLPFPDGAFDDVIASLVLHSLEDWTAPLAELRRVLRPGGRLIVADNHPFVSQQLACPCADYFATREWSEGIHLRRLERPAELLAPADAPDDRRLHRSGLPDSRHQRTIPRTRRPRAVP